MAWTGKCSEDEENLPIVDILKVSKVGMMWDIQQEIEDIEGINSASVVTGPFDIIAIAELQTMKALR